MAIIEVNNLTYRYTKKKYALKDVSFKIERGEFVSIVGHNGSGKSTLGKLLCGLLQTKHGEILIDGIKLSDDTIDAVRQKIGIVFQNPDNQFVGVTVKNDIAFGLENRNIDVDEMEKRIKKYATIVGMDEFLDKNPENLSGGQKQRVAIASVLAMETDILIFDEATSMIDPQGVKEVTNAIKSLKEEKTIIYITHNLAETLMGDRMIVLKNGEIVLDDEIDNAIKQKDILTNSNLEPLEQMELIELVNKNNLNRKEEVEKVLWQSAYQK